VSNPLTEVQSGAVHSPTVMEIAVALRVFTAAVYDMIVRGELEHVRVSNSIRVLVR
jgi:hypothetical protein